LKKRILCDRRRRGRRFPSARSALRIALFPELPISDRSRPVSQSFWRPRRAFRVNGLPVFGIHRPFARAVFRALPREIPPSQYLPDVPRTRVNDRALHRVNRRIYVLGGIFPRDEFRSRRFVPARILATLQNHVSRFPVPQRPPVRNRAVRQILEKPRRIRIAP